MKEMIRVLRPKGSLFINFQSVDDSAYGQGEDVGPNEYCLHALHTFFDDGEPECFFEGTEMNWKLKWIEEFTRNGSWIKRASLVYLAQKVGKE
jgi:hypothetical protein